MERSQKVHMCFHFPNLHMCSQRGGPPFAPADSARARPLACFALDRIPRALCDRAPIPRVPAYGHGRPRDPARSLLCQRFALPDASLFLSTVAAGRR